ncbi:acyltransferase [Puteibacter caeruleilacunae]|nr:acyltransferase [Puteibacter caeruleilacunae]
MDKQIQHPKERQYYIDWLRIILILSVFLYHIGMIFNANDWHIKNDVTYGYDSALGYTMTFLGLWRMPLLILISGAGTFFALGKRTPGQYLTERFKRLLIPLTAGIFILVPIQVFLERVHLYDSLFDYYPHMFEGVYPSGNFSWHHLWFIAYLFFIALLITPLLNVLRSHQFKRFVQRLEPTITRRLGANIFLIPIIASQLLLRPYFPDNTHDLVNDWAAVTSFFLYFLSGYIIISSNKITHSIKENKFFYLAQAVIATYALFSFHSMNLTEETSRLIWRIISNTLTWSCGITVLGFAKQYLNTNNNFRHLCNEAIYPFYLLHQPIIVIMAFVLVPWQVSVFWKATIIIISSFSLTVLVYFYLVKPFNLMRVIFGMKPIKKAVHQAKRKEVLVTSSSSNYLKN